MPPMTIGNQPPSGILSAFDARNAMSIVTSGITMTSAARRFQRHNLVMTKKISSESIAIASVTAMPYAAARLLELRKPATSSITAHSKVQLMKGT